MSSPDIWLIRHGHTAWSRSGQHTGVTDVPLLPEGETAARRLAPVLANEHFALVLTSPLQRARTTAAQAGFPHAIVDRDLSEWNYGELDGITTPDIQARGGAFADWRVWTGPVPGGETIRQVETRMRRVLARAEAVDGTVLLFGHGHSLRLLTALALELDPRTGARFSLDPATINVIGNENGLRALRRWNVPD